MKRVKKMKICGLAKMTLLDFPGKVAATVFTGGCNFRCPFCHNASLVLTPGLDEVSNEEFFSMLKKRQGLLDGVCITGGEPLLQPDLEDFIKKIRALNYEIKLDTNGSSPLKLKRLVKEKLVDYVAMDIKAGRDNYGKVIGVENFDISPIDESVKFLKSGQVPYEFRTTAVCGLHSENDFSDIADWLAGDENYYIQKFVDSGDLIGTNVKEFTNDEMRHFLEIVKKRLPKAELRGVD